MYTFILQCAFSPDQVYMSFCRQASIRRHKQSATKLFTETGTELGRRAYGLIFEVDYLGTPCAAKKVHATLLENANEDTVQKINENFKAECRIWKSLRHPHIVQLLKVCNDPVWRKCTLA